MKYSLVVCALLGLVTVEQIQSTNALSISQIDNISFVLNQS